MALRPLLLSRRFHFLKLVTFAMASGDAGRDRMISEIGAGGSNMQLGDASGKTILMRGCDPVMAERAGAMLPPLLGNVQIVAVTTDAEFFDLLASEQRFDVVGFAPGACRYSAARQTIPVGDATTKSWTLEEYKAKVREHQGAEVPIVETLAEAEIVPLLRGALGLQ